MGFNMMPDVSRREALRSSDVCLQRVGMSSEVVDLACLQAIGQDCLIRLNILTGMQST
jgi:hypothetical protein